MLVNSLYFQQLATNNQQPLCCASRNQPQLRLPPDPSTDSHVLQFRRLQVFQVLLQCFFIELRQELRHGGGVQPSDIIDQLTFAHGVFSFR